MTDLIAIGSVYKLVSPLGLVYIGSTKKKLADRLSGHKADYKRFLQGKRGFVTSMILFKEGNKIIIELLEEIKVCSKMNLLMLEKKYIESIECVNRYVPILNDEEKKEYQKDFRKEYYVKNKDLIRKKEKEYYEKNVTAIKERQYEKIHCDACKCETSSHHKARHDKTQKHIKNAKAYQQTNTATTINITNNYYATSE